MLAALETRNGMISNTMHGSWPSTPAASMSSRIWSPSPIVLVSPVVGDAATNESMTPCPNWSIAFRNSSLCCAAVNTSMILIIAVATILTPSSRSPSTLLLTLASSRVNTIARTMLATGFTAVCATERLRL